MALTGFRNGSILLLASALLAFGKPGSDPAAASARGDRLDQAKIHADYNEGNFDLVISALEGFLAANKAHSFGDSVFVAKHLAVVYSANPGTREKGKYYMHQLLSLLPSAKLVDMYVSDEIDRIFDKVREEFIARQGHFGVDTSRMALPAKPPERGEETGKSAAPGRTASPDKPDRKRGNAGLWIAGGATMALVGVTAAYFIHQSEEAPSPADRVYRVGKD